MWQLHRHEWILDVIPIDDIKEHLMADECWCAPRVEALGNMKCQDGWTRGQKLFVHNAADRRELKERKRDQLLKDLLRGQ